MLKTTKLLLKNLGVQILIAMVIGIAVGAFYGTDAKMFQPIGDVFISLIKMLVIPLVAVSVTSGAASLGDAKSAGKLGIATFVYYLGTTAVAVIIGIVFGEIFQPGSGIDVAKVQQWFSHEKAGSATPPEFWHLILSIIPTNPIKALTDGNILQTLFFCLFLGIGIGTLEKEKKSFILNLLNSLTEALIWMIKIVMLVAPFGVFALMASATGTFGYKILELVVKLLLVYIGAILLHGFGFYPLMLKLFSKMPIKKFMSKIYKPQIVALSTASSMATLPMTFETCEEELGVSNETSSFVLPLGATINMDGNAIYYALAALFFAQLFGLDLTMANYVAIVLTATVGSIGQAGVPGPSLLVVAVLVSAGIPIEGLPLLYAVDRIFDMIRTALNITGDATCAIIVDKFNTKHS